MRRAPLAATAAFVVLGVVAFLLLRRPDEGERPEQRARPIARLPAGAFDTLDIQARGKRTTVVREGERFTVAAPVLYPADETAARGAFAAIENLDLVAVVTDRKERQVELEVDEGRGVRVTVRRGQRPLIDLVVGKVVEQGTMVRPWGHDQIWRAGGELRDVFDKGPVDWRDKTIADFVPGDARRIEIEARDRSRMVLARRAATAGRPEGWQVAESSVKIDRFDEQAARDLVASLSSFKTNDFADGVAPAAAGLEHPALRVTAVLAAGDPITVLFGDAAGRDDVFVRNAQSPQIFLVKRFNLERIDRRPIQFRDKTLCNVADRDIVEIAVAHGADSYTLVKRAGNWRATRPAGLKVDPDRVAPFSSVFRAWFAPEIAEGLTPAAAPPPIVVVGKTQRASCTIEVVGEPPGGGGYLVRTPRSRDVYIVPKWMIDRIAVKLDAIRKA